MDGFLVLGKESMSRPLVKKNFLWLMVELHFEKTLASPTMSSEDTCEEMPIQDRVPLAEATTLGIDASTTPDPVIVQLQPTPTEIMNMMCSMFQPLLERQNWGRFYSRERSRSHTCEP